jgi:hypothetical protein
MDSNIRYQDNLPQEIKEKIQLSVEQDAAILDLETRLREMRIKQTELLRELAPFRHLRHEIGQGSSYEQIEGSETFIHRCPTEILILIFEYSIAKNHSRIRSLLVICRRWYHIVMDTPTLWATIQITKSDLKSHDVYIAACNERSRSALMDIDLDFTEFPSHREYTRRKIGTLLRTICDPREELPMRRYEMEIEFEFPPPEYVRQVQELLSCLSGPVGEHRRRWRSLSWILPNSRIIASILYSSFQGVTPHLKKLQILGGPGDFQPHVPPQQRFQAPNLQYLQIPAAASISQFVGFAGSLRELDITLFGDIRSISSFQLLKVLKIRASMFRSTTIQPSIISLPHLITFTLTEEIDILRPLQLDFPALQNLNIRTVCAEDFGKFRQLSPLHINWDDDGFRWGHAKERTETILRMSSKLLTLTVPASQAQITWTIVKQYQSEGHIPAFTQLRVETGGKVVNIEDWDDVETVD